MTVDVSSAGRSGRRRPAVKRPAERHRLEVLAVTVDDVVRGAGGWLADRALAGWDVDVLVAQPILDAGAVRSLRIIGASAHVLHQDLGARPRADAVAVSAELFTADARVRDRVLRAYDRDLVEVTVWGQVIPAELRTRLAGVEHVLSSAAQAFKGHALCAATPFAVKDQVGVTELFRTGALRGMADDLIPAAADG